MAPCWEHEKTAVSEIKKKKTLFPSTFEVWDIAVSSFSVDHVNKLPSLKLKKKATSQPIKQKPKKTKRTCRTSSCYLEVGPL